MTSTVRVAVAALVLVVVAGCGGSDRADVAEPQRSVTPSPTAERSPSPSAARALPNRCENPREGYALRYPDDWHVAAGDTVEPCTFFDDEPLQLAGGTETTGVAIRVDLRDVPLPQARQDTLAEGDQQAEDREVGDRRAVRLTGTLTEEVLLPAGTRITTWLVELDGRTLLMTADDHGAQDYDAAVEVLDAMVQSLEVL